MVYFGENQKVFWHSSFQFFRLIKIVIKSQDESRNCEKEKRMFIKVNFMEIKEWWVKVRS